MASPPRVPNGPSRRLFVTPDKIRRSRAAQLGREPPRLSPTIVDSEYSALNTEGRPIAASEHIVYADGEKPQFKSGDSVRVDQRSPVGHYRVPKYMRGKPGVVEALIEPRAVDSEQEGFGRNAGDRGYYYRIAVRLTDIWAGYRGSPRDSVHIEIFESWLERI